ncbi:MAG: hypothetical protein OHK0029_19370 [Armatimonadaceae bacterium]
MTKPTFDLDSFPTFGKSVRDFGATGTGESDDWSAFQRALNSGHQRLIVPPGVYRIGQTLHIGSGTHLRLHPAAQIRLADGAGVHNHIFLLTNRDPEKGDRDICVEGGIWDGNNRHNPRGDDQPQAYTGVMLHFSHVTNLTLRDMTLRDPESYYIRIGKTRRFRVEDIRFQARSIRPNQDGVHLGGFCEDGIIQNLSGVGASVPSDDVVALNADDANDRAQNLGMVCGWIRRIQIRRIHAEDCHTFVRLLSVQSAIEDILIEDVSGGCQVAAINMDACRECRVKLFDPSDSVFANGVGNLARIEARNLHVYKSKIGQHKPLIDFRSLANALTIENLQRDLARDAAPETPTIRASDIPGSLLFLDGLTEAQARALQETSDTHPMRLRFLRSTDWDTQTPLLRAEATLEAGQQLTLPFGGFRHLSAVRPPAKPVD